MNKAILFKALQRKLKFRNPHDQRNCPKLDQFSSSELLSANSYIQSLEKLGISYSHPEHSTYPVAFQSMREPPLFFEYLGQPVWNKVPVLSVVGARKIQPSTQSWMRSELTKVLQVMPLSICSGGAVGVDALAHAICILENRPTIAVMPSGLNNLYPASFASLVPRVVAGGGAVISEFELLTQPHKSHFYHRNRLISALGCMTLVTQAGLRSGTMLTVHHCLQNGRAVVTLPAHPESHEFAGNLQIIEDGGCMVTNASALMDLFKFESNSYAMPQPTCSEDFGFQAN